MLEHAYRSQGLEIHHIVFGIPSQVDKPADNAKGTPATYKSSPLSWKLTESQKEYIRQWATEEQPTKDSLADAVNWLRHPAPDSASNGIDVCSVDDQPPR